MPPALSLRRRIALNITEKVKQNLVRKHPLTQLFWECTLRCNLSCRHCGSDCRQTSSIKDMPKEDFARVLDSIATTTDPHKVMVNITGGEPLCRPDLEECGRKGSFERAAAAIKMVVDSGEIAFDVVTCVNKRSLRQLPEIREFLIGLGLKEWRLFTIFPAGRALDDPELQLSPEEFRQLLDFIKDTRKQRRIMASYGCEGFLGNYEGDVRNHFYICSAGITVASVLADGSISACPSIRADYHQGNIYTDDFMEVWNNRFQPYRDREWMQKDACASCKVWKYCLGNGRSRTIGIGAENPVYKCSVESVAHKEGDDAKKE